MRSFIAVLALSLFAVVNAATRTVQVGANSTLEFSPHSLDATQGDVVVFRFMTGNHTVTQSTFSQPCNYKGLDSGFRPVSNTSHPTFNVTISNSSTLYFYCKPHCKGGMLFMVNPTAERSFEAFQANAKSQNPNSTSSTISFGTGASTSATPTSTEGAAIRFGQANLGIITAVAVFFGLVL